MNELPSTTSTILRALAFLCLMTSVLVAPWFFGAVQYWAQLVLLVAAILACGLTIALCLIDDPGTLFPKAGWIGLTLLMLGVFQLYQWSPATLEHLSPSAVELRVDFGQSADATMPISLHPAVTRSTVAVLVLGMLVFTIAHRCIENWMFRWALLLVAVNGALLTIVAIWQRQTGDNLLYGMIESNSNAVGPFVNRNNAAGYLVASLAASIGLVARSVASLRSESVHGRVEFADFLNPLHNPVGMLGMLSGVLIAAGIVMTASRGGCLALGIAALSTLAVVIQRNHMKVAFLSISLVGAASVGLLAYFEHWDPASERISTVTDEHVLAQDGRLRVWSNSIVMVRDYWITGTGLGTFRDIYRVYDQQADGTIYTHAENQFIQAACELGIPGLLLVLCAVGCLAFTVFKLLTVRDAFIRTVGAVGMFFIVSQVVANSFDFGFSIPANMVLLALLAGIVTGVASRAEQDDLATETGDAPTIGPSGFRRVLELISGRQVEFVLVGLGTMALFAAVDLMKASSLETLPAGFRPTVVADDPSLIDPRTGVWNDQGQRLARNIHTRWDDAKAHLTLADWYIYRYEQQLASQMRNDADRIIPVARLGSVVRQLRAAPDRNGAVTKLVELDAVTRNLKTALKHLHAARNACCLLPKVHLRLLHLAFLESEDGTQNDEDRAASLDRVVRLLEGQRYDQFVRGMELFEQGDYPEAFAAWKPCLDANSYYTDQIVAHAAEVKPIPELFGVLFPTDDAFLTQLANKHFADPSQREHRNEVLTMLSARQEN